MGKCDQGKVYVLRSCESFRPNNYPSSTIYAMFLTEELKFLIFPETSSDILSRCVLFSKSYRPTENIFQWTSLIF